MPELKVMAHKGRGKSHYVNVWDVAPDTAQRLTDLERMRDEALARAREIECQYNAVIESFRNEYRATEEECS